MNIEVAFVVLGPRRRVSMTRLSNWVAPLLVAAVTLLVAPPAAGTPRHDAFGVIRLDGVLTDVRWTDGDSFSIGGPKRQDARLLGYNTLEAYGPVHSWGDWTPEALLPFVLDAAQIVASETWACCCDGSLDTFGRLLVACPELAVEMVRRGHALAYAVDSAAPEPVLADPKRGVR